MNTNVLKAFSNIIENPNSPVDPAKISNNRINNVGDALENYVKDAFCSLLGVSPITDLERDNDYLFTGKKLYDACVSCEVIDDENLYTISDHNPIIAEFDLR